MFNLDEGQTPLKTLTTDTYDSLNKFFRRYNTSKRKFKLVVGKNDPTTFLPLNANTGGQIRSSKHKYKENKYITEVLARHVYRKVESGNIININTLKQEIDQDQELNRPDDTSRAIMQKR